MALFDAEKYRGMRVCVALSGGVDSVCLLHAFKEQAEGCDIALSALHIEHGIRGEESFRDMQFCKTLCERWGIPLEIVRADVPALAKERGKSMEEVARAVRYEAFRARIGDGKTVVATAHHLNDVAETILFRLARGTGLSGMKAIAEYGGIVRPLLARTRAEIEEYAREHGLPHVEDSTNGDETYTRNYIRHTALPAFEKIHQQAARHLVEFASLAAEEDRFLQSLADSKIVRMNGEARVPVDLPEVLFARACLACMGSADYSAANLAELKKLKALQSGRRVCLPEGLAATREGDMIVFYAPREAPTAEIPFAAEAAVYEFGGKAVRVLTEDPGHALRIDADRLPAGCVLRTRREGDVFTPYGGGTKTLKKFLTDRKIPARTGRELPLVAHGSEVLAIVGVEISDKVKVTEKTERVRYLV